MTTPATVPGAQSPFADIADQLGSIAPRTLADARTTAAQIVARCQSLTKTWQANSSVFKTATSIVEALTAAPAPKTLPQAREAFDRAHGYAAAHVGLESSGLLPADPVAPTTPNLAELSQRATARQAARPAIAATPAAIAIPPPPPSDAAIFETYQTLLGDQRKAFIAAYSEPLWREYRRRETAKHRR
jgi:hypothetical protein